MEVSFFITIFAERKKKKTMFDLYKTYNKAKNVFIKPKLKVSFGLWKNVGGLPVWRRGPFLTIGKNHQYYTPQYYNHYRQEKKGDIRADGSVVESAKYGLSYHKAPNGYYGPVWIRRIRKNLRKWGLGWLKPQYILPLWTAFYIFDYDVIYKWKYDSVRYEYPPQFTIVAFGIALSFTLIAPTEKDNDCADWYWESLLSYLYEYDKDLVKTIKGCGEWTHYRDGIESKSFQVKKWYIKPECHDVYDRAIKEYYLENSKK